MNITPTEIYWIMQADSICIALNIAAVALGISMLFLAIFSVAFLVEEGYKEAKSVIFAAIVCTLVALPVVTCAILAPSTQTLCTVYTVPKIVNSGVIESSIEDLKDARQEVKDIYKIGKEALINISKKEEAH